MLDEETRQRLVSAFANWLEEQSELPEPGEMDRTPDLFTFFSELTALKQELSVQSRSSRNGLAELTEAVGNLQQEVQAQDTRALAEDLVELRRQAPMVKEEAEKALLLEIISLRDALAGNCAGFAGQRLRGFFASRKDAEMLARAQQNESLLVKKADDILRRYDVRPIAAVGASFDAARMRAVAVSEDASAAPGTVTRVDVQGYVRSDKILVTAEVEVRK